MRLFTAIDLPPEILGRVAELITQLRPSARIRWSPVENLHITTKFIGHLPDERLAEVNSALASLSPRQPIEIRIAGLGFFPNAKSPRVFWAGVQGGPALAALAQGTDRALTRFVEPEARAYSPHLTLARIKEPGPLAALHKKIQALAEPEFGSFVADRFYLYLSKPGPGGSVYTKLSEFPITIS